MAIISTGQQEQLKTRFHFAHGLRFEIFYALQTLTDDTSRIHTTWKARAKKELPAEFWQIFNTIGGAPMFWPLIADAFQTLDPNSAYDKIVDYLEDLDPHAFRERVLIGAIHSPEWVDALVRGKCDLEEVVTRSPEDKQPWFACLGIYPYNREAPAAVGLQRLIEAPDELKRAALCGMDLFWNIVFSETWDLAEPQLEKSQRVKMRFFDSSSLAEFINQILMRLEVDEENRVLRALRGGCILPFDEIEAIYVLPSLFNDSRLWATYEHDEGIAVFLPYFDPSIDLDGDARQDWEQFAAPKLDPALIFKALGDNTRYALARLIGEEPRAAGELAKILKVSKPTISHHVHLLREAGLLNEDYANGSVQLSLKRDVIEALSAVAVGKLFRSAV
jgi:DNA-binding transcriptional ArsR family regulator